MAKSRDRDSGIFRWFVDDRSGLEYGFQPITSYPNAYGRESGRPVKDQGLKVSPTSYDMPPPSKKPLGGEGDISGDPRANSDFTPASNAYIIPPESVKEIFYVNSSRSISWNEDPVVYIVGSNANQIMAANPQFLAAQAGKSIAVQCVGSSVTITTGNGVNFDFRGSQVRMDSGAIVTMIYNGTDSSWHVTSFNSNGGF